MSNRREQASANLEDARELRAAGRSYREIRRILSITTAQLGHVRRVLKREKAGRTRLRSMMPQATDRDLPVSQSVLPIGLRKILAASGHRTLGDVANRIDDPSLPGLEAIPGIGPQSARRVRALLEHYSLLAGPSDLQHAVEQLFPELRDATAREP